MNDYIQPVELAKAYRLINHGPTTLVSGCAAWLYCELIPEEHNQQAYDLFIGEIKAAWADTRIFRDGHWQFEHASSDWRSLHYIAGGHFYTTGEVLEVPDVPSDTPGAPQG